MVKVICCLQSNYIGVASQVMKQCSLNLTEEMKLTTKICIAKNIIRNKKPKHDTKNCSCVLSTEKGFGKMTKVLNAIIDMITVILIIGIPAMLGALVGAAIGWLLWMW